MYFFICSTLKDPLLSWNHGSILLKILKVYLSYLNLYLIWNWFLGMLWDRNPVFFFSCSESVFLVSYVCPRLIYICTYNSGGHNVIIVPFLILSYLCFTGLFFCNFGIPEGLWKIMMNFSNTMNYMKLLGQVIVIFFLERQGRSTIWECSVFGQSQAFWSKLHSFKIL